MSYAARKVVAVRVEPSWAEVGALQSHSIQSVAAVSVVQSGPVERCQKITRPAEVSR